LAALQLKVEFVLIDRQAGRQAVDDSGQAWTM
jgi:hypothetical protein